ncbi:WD40 repeat domain-containing protein [Streptomyces milbemycinicus]|uniref:WD40 repeat domain-containing protein n=1 Tax=Streptomyces milbemycinicus TaxID=476552 RepID=UPI00340B5754
MTDSRLIKSSMIPSEGNVDDFAVVDVNGRPWVVCASRNDVWTWDLIGDAWLERPLDDFDNGSYGIPVYPDFEHMDVTVVDGRLLFAAGGQHQGPGLWDVISGELLDAPPEFRSCVHALGMTSADGRITLVAGAAAPEVWVWDPSDPEVEAWGPTDDEYAEEQEPRELPGHSGDMSDLVVGRLRGRPVVVSGGDGEVLLSDLESEELVHKWFADGLVHAVALSEVDGRPVVLAVTDSGELRSWDAVGGEPVGRFPTGHTGRTSALAAAVVGARTLAVTGSDDGTARVWDLAEGRQIGAPLAGHEGEVWTVAITLMGGRHVVLTAGRGGVVRVWDPSV